jgi:hypothetical protein
VHKIPLYLRYPKTFQHPPCLHRVNRLLKIMFRKSHHLMATFPTFSGLARSFLVEVQLKTPFQKQ